MEKKKLELILTVVGIIILICFLFIPDFISDKIEKEEERLPKIDRLKKTAIKWVESNKVEIDRIVDEHRRKNEILSPICL